MTKQDVPSGISSVILTGMHSGPNPSPGLGTARSLRARYPGLTLIGLDYSNQSSGLHSRVLDETVCMPSWSEIDVNTWVGQVRELVSTPGTLLISGLDLESRLLAERAPDCAELLIPPSNALDLVRKPPSVAAERLGLDRAASESDTSWSSVDSFLRTAGSRVWVKGDYHEAVQVSSTAHALAAGASLQATWSDRWHLESDLPGQECGVAFCARDGVLLDAVFMEKAQLTQDGKTWAGSVSDVGPVLLELLARFLLDVGWTGGGELELVRDWHGRLALMEINPRFPAWIHGSTVCGINLPATLVDGKSGRAPIAQSRSFTRVVEEVAVNPGIGLAPYAWSVAGHPSAAGKHPSGMTMLGRLRQSTSPISQLTRRARDNEAETEGTKVPLDPSLAQLGDPRGNVTPARVLLPDALALQLDRLRNELSGMGEVVIGYSIKTNPSPRLMNAAARLGLAAKAISTDELSAAEKAGFDTASAILNGPGKWWPQVPGVRCSTVFLDSTAEMLQLHRMLDAGFNLDTVNLGVRVAPVDSASRFGIGLHDIATFTRTAALLRRLIERLDCEWGMLFHYAESTLGADGWLRECYAALSSAGPMTEALGCPPAVLDFGGGWHVDDIALVGSSIRQVVDRLSANGSVTGRPTLAIEPGKLLVQPAVAVVTRVLLIDRFADPHRVIVDAALGDLPEASSWPHPLARFDGARWQPIPTGSGDVLGRSCMEADILARGVVLDDLHEGDYLAFGMCGAYDASMAYDFGRGSLLTPEYHR